MRVNFDISFIRGIGNSVRNDRAQGEDSLVFEGKLGVDESSCAMDGGFLEEYVDYVSPQAQKIIEGLNNYEQAQDWDLILKERLANPDLKTEDRLLIEEFMAAKSEIRRLKVFVKVCRVLAELNGQEMRTYDGIRSTCNSSSEKRINALWYALNAAINLTYDEDKTKEIDKLVARRIIKNVGYLEEYLSADDCEKIKDLDAALAIGDTTKIAQARVNLLVNLFRAGAYFSSRPLGSKQKIEAFRRQNALYYALMSRGVRDEEITLLSYRFEVPALSTQEYEKIIKFQKVIGTPEKSDDQREKGKLLKYVSSKIKECNSLPASDIDRKMVIERTVEICAMIGRQMGVKFAELEKAVKKGGGIRPSYLGSQITMVDLAKNNFAVSPQQLPQKVIDLLKKYGYWKIVKAHAKKIVLLRDIKESSYVANSVGNTGGQAYPLVGAVYLDVWDEWNGKVISAEEIVSTLVHEVGGHFVWHKEHFNDEYLLSVTVDERNAFLRQYLVLEKMVKDNPDLTKKLESKIKGNEKGIRAANKVLGYPEDDLTFRTELSSEAKEKDLDTYPLNL